MAGPTFMGAVSENERILGMSASGSDAKSQQYANMTSGSFLAPGQMGGLTNLWDRASGFTNAEGAKANANRVRDWVQPGLQQGFNSLLGLTDATGQIAAQEASLKSGLGSLFRDEINPAISSGALGAGGYGGGRQGVAQGVAAGQLGNSYTQGLGDITARANAQAGQAATQLGPMAGLMGGVANMGQTAGQAMLANLSNILGDPKVLQKSSSESASTSKDQSFGFGKG
jgi:hypothetical protein